MGFRLRNCIRVIPALWLKLCSCASKSVGGRRLTGEPAASGAGARSTSGTDVDREDAAHADTPPAKSACDSLWFWLLLVVLAAVVLRYLVR